MRLAICELPHDHLLETKGARLKDRQQVHEFVSEVARAFSNPLEDFSLRIRRKETADTLLWMFTLEIIERDHPIRSDIGKTTVQ